MLPRSGQVSSMGGGLGEHPGPDADGALVVAFVARRFAAGDGDDASEETEIGVPPPLPDAQAPDVPASFAHDLRHVPPHGRRRNTPPLNPQAKAFTMRENFSHAHASPAYLHVLPEFSPWMPSPWNPAPRTRQPWV